MALDASPSVAWLLPGHILFCMKGVIEMLHSAFFRRIICLLIVCCFVFCTFGQIKARADAGIGAVLWQAGTAVGITPETAIACILVLLGVAVVAGNSDDFWGLVSQIAADIGDLITMDFTLDNGKGVELVEAWLYDGTYHFPQETIKSVHEYLLEDTVSYDADTDSLVHSGYVYNGWTTTFGEGTLDKVLTWLFCNYPAQYELANNYEKCIAIHYTDATWRYLFSNDSFQLIESDEGNYYLYPDEFVAVHVNADGSFSLATDGYGFGVSAFEEGLYYYKSRIPIDTSNLARNLDDYSGLRIVETSGPDPDDSGKDITLSMIAVTVIGATEAIESMTQIEAQTGDNSAPDVVVDLDTGEVIDANGDTADAIFGRSVAVDAETAIASILISLGVSPGADNTDFRQLVTDIMSVLSSEYTYFFSSAAYGDLTLLNAWLYNDIYYFSQDIMEFVNDYIWGNTEYGDAVILPDGFYFSSDFLYYNEVYNRLLGMANEAMVKIFLNSTSCLGIIDSSGMEWYLYSAGVPSFDPSTGIALVGPYPFVVDSWSSDGHNFSRYVPWVSSDNQFDFSPYISDVVRVELVSISGGLCYDLNVFDMYELLSDFSFDILTVTENGADLTYYPVKLFPSLADTEAATQTEIQTDYTTSVPAISVDPDTRVIIEVNIPGSDEVPDVGTDNDTNTDTDTDTDTDSTTATSPGGDSGSDSDTGTDSSDNVDTGSGVVTEDGLWSVLVRFGQFLVNLLWSPFRWLGNMLLEGLWPFFEWVGSVLLEGIQTLGDKLLEGIQDLFVPDQDYLSEKIDTLCEDFVFAYAIVETAQFIGDSLSGLGTTPPVIYLNLGAATGSYYFGGQVPFIDMRWYAAYKPTGDALLSALLWICFCWRVFVKLPGIISGVSGQFSHLSSSDDRKSR